MLDNIVNLSYISLIQINANHYLFPPNFFLPKTHLMLKEVFEKKNYFKTVIIYIKYYLLSIFVLIDIPKRINI